MEPRKPAPATALSSAFCRPRSVLLAVLFGAFLAQTSFARLGATLDECELRYGKPVEILKPDGVLSQGHVFMFDSDGYRVWVTLRNKWVDSIGYRKLLPSGEEPTMENKPPPLTGEEVEELLKRNLRDRPFKVVKTGLFGTNYETEDGEVVAMHSTLSNTLLIMTKEHFDEAAAAQENSRAGSVQALTAP